MCKVTLADGTIIDNLELNGNNFISSNPRLNAADFEGKMATVTIEYPSEVEGEDPTIEVINDAVLAKLEHDGAYTYFVLREKYADEKAAEVVAAALKTDGNNIVDLQLAVVELYELIIGE